jgi:hypothetical protein
LNAAQQANSKNGGINGVGNNNELRKLADPKTTRHICPWDCEFLIFKLFFPIVYFLLSREMPHFTPKRHRQPVCGRHYILKYLHKFD